MTTTGSSSGSAQASTLSSGTVVSAEPWMTSVSLATAQEEDGPKLQGLTDHQVLQRDANGFASIPIALYELEAQGGLTPGDLVLIVGFGSGLTHAGALIRW